MGAACTAESSTGSAGSPAHRNAVVWVIPWEFATEADFRLFSYGLATDKALSEVLQTDFSPSQLCCS